MSHQQHQLVSRIVGKVIALFLEVLNGTDQHVDQRAQSSQESLTWYTWWIDWNEELSRPMDKESKVEKVYSSLGPGKEGPKIVMPLFKRFRNTKGYAFRSAFFDGHKKAVTLFVANCPHEVKNMLYKELTRRGQRYSFQQGCEYKKLRFQLTKSQCKEYFGDTKLYIPRNIEKQQEQQQERRIEDIPSTSTGITNCKRPLAQSQPVQPLKSTRYDPGRDPRRVSSNLPGHFVLSDSSKKVQTKFIHLNSNSEPGEIGTEITLRRSEGFVTADSKGWMKKFSEIIKQFWTYSHAQKDDDLILFFVTENGSHMTLVSKYMVTNHRQKFKDDQLISELLDDVNLRHSMMPRELFKLGVYGLEDNFKPVLHGLLFKLYMCSKSVHGFLLPEQQ